VDGLSELRAIASAPGKVILFGEHAVIYGHPAIAATTNQRTFVEVDVVGSRTTVNGHRIHERYHSYLLTAVDRLWTKPEAVRLQTEGGVPSASGTGSSSALTVAAVAALHQLLGDDHIEEIAQDAFEVERITQGGGSPVDTSASTAGGGIAISGIDNPPGIGDPMWDIEWEGTGWAVESIPIPELTMVVGNSGVKGRTDAEVAKVARAVQKNTLLKDTLQDIGDITRQAVAPLAVNDWVTIGALMDKAHSCMHTLGVNHPAVQKLIDVAHAQPGTFGAKITGAGGGGSMVALTEKPAELAAAIAAAGGTPYEVKLGGPGVQWHASAEEIVEAA
jgi:mevalonate kinase